MENKLDLILNKLDNINSRLNNIELEIKKIKESSGKMDNHIDFIEDTYETLKYPIEYVKKSFDKYISNKDLPTIENKKDK